MDETPQQVVATTKTSMSNFAYKGWRSTTLHLVVIGYISTTGLLVCSFIDMMVWKDTAFAMLALYVARDGVTKISEKWAEAYIAKQTK